MNYSEYYLNSIKNTIENLDQKFKHSQERKNMKWIVHQIITRKIKILNGILNVHLTRYKKIQNNKIVTCYAPEIENYFKKGDVIQPDIKSKVLNLYVNSNSSFRQLATIFQISRQTVKNIFDKEKTEKQLVNFTELAANKKIIHLEIDDTFARIKTNTSQTILTRFRMLTFHLGKNEKNEIIGKFSVVEGGFLKNSINDWVKIIFKTLKQVYGKTNFTILLSADGAKWIKQLAEQIDAIYFLDKFHILKNAFDKFGYSKTKNKKNLLSLKKFEKKANFIIYKKFKEHILNLDYANAINFLENLTKQKSLFQKYVDFKKISNYLKFNYDQRMVMFKNYFPGCHTEIFVSHLKKHFKRKFATFKLKSIKQLIMLKYNNIFII